MKKMYIVKYSSGSYEDYCEICVFVTINKSRATKYVTKLNKLVKKWREYYKQFEGDDGLCSDWISDDHLDKFNRWYSLKQFNNAYWEEIEIR